MKRIYTSPEILVELCSKEDIMEGSDTFIDVSELWSAAELAE